MFLQLLTVSLSPRHLTIPPPASSLFSNPTNPPLPPKPTSPYSDPNVFPPPHAPPITLASQPYRYSLLILLRTLVSATENYAGPNSFERET